ncbi:MAG: deoxyribonuclease IV [Sphaerochaetaceae bacterium]|nr:deoxyribonuclease IV [Sphaerochaetaceae bacterium]
MHIGCHLSVSEGFLAMGMTASSIGADTFQFFSRNPRGSKARPLDEEDAALLVSYMKDKSFSKIIAHAPYTLNPCSADESIRKFALATMKDDLARMESIPNQLYNFHPGSHTNQGVEKGIEQIACMLNAILNEEQTTTVLLETMAGKGSEVGSRFEELRAIIDSVNLSCKVGICLDTCHVFDAGYDIRNHLDEVLNEFDEVIGLNRLKAVHLNDSMNIIGSHRDRHQKIGEGEIGLEALKNIVCSPRLKDLPFCLETPNEIDGYAREIAMLKDYQQNRRSFGI